MKYSDKTRQNMLSQLLISDSRSAYRYNPVEMSRYLSPQTHCCHHSEKEQTRRQVIDININININTNINFQGRNQRQNFENLHWNQQEISKKYENQYAASTRKSMHSEIPSRQQSGTINYQIPQSRPVQQNRTQHRSPLPVFSTSSIPVQPSHTTLNIHHLHAKSPPMRQQNNTSTSTVKRIVGEMQPSIAMMETPKDLMGPLPPLYETPKKISHQSINNISAPSFIPLPPELSTETTPHTFVTERFQTHCYSDVQEFKFSRDSPIKMIDGQEHVEEQLVHLFSAPPVSPENPQKPLYDGDSYGSLKIRTGVQNAINLLELQNSSIQSIPSSERQNFARTLYGPFLKKMESHHKQFPSVITEQSNFSSEMSSPNGSSKGGNLSSSKTSVAHHVQQNIPENGQVIQSSSFSKARVHNYLSPQNKLRLAVSPGAQISSMVSPPKLATDIGKVRLPLNMLARWDWNKAS